MNEENKTQESGSPDPDTVSDSEKTEEVQSKADQSVAAKVRKFPQTPGVYLFKDEAGVVIYVGKAKNLRSRAGSYF